MIVDANGENAIAAPCAEAVAERLAARWNKEKKRTGAPVRIGWTDGASTALMEMMKKYAFVIPARRQADWRAADAKGAVPSLNLACRLVATDGVVAYFVLGDEETLFYGHLANFVEDKPEPRSGQESDEKRSRKSRDTVALAWALLEKLLAEHESVLKD